MRAWAHWGAGLQSVIDVLDTGPTLDMPRETTPPLEASAARCTAGMSDAGVFRHNV